MKIPQETGKLDMVFLFGGFAYRCDAKTLWTFNKLMALSRKLGHTNSVEEIIEIGLQDGRIVVAGALS